MKNITVKKKSIFLPEELKTTQDTFAGKYPDAPQMIFNLSPIDTS